jgi:hypothetical protein
MSESVPRNAWRWLADWRWWAVSIAGALLFAALVYVEWIVVAYVEAVFVGRWLQSLDSEESAVPR